MLKYETVVVSEFQQNSRIIWCSNTKEGVILDPGAEPERILARIKDLGVKVTAVWLTHSHLDHCGAVLPILEVLKVPLVASLDEVALRANVSNSAAMFGLDPAKWPNCPEPDVPVAEGDKVSVGDHTALVLAVPGHSPGHIAFYFSSDGMVFSGDCLFLGSIGRTDLPGGNHAQLIKSIVEKLLTLPSNTKVMTGHGEDTEIGAEARSNPFLRS